MADLKVINVNIGVYDKNNTIAEEIRVRNKMNRTFLANIMASPGAGKTSVLLRTIEALRNDYSIGVMEADIDATVDAEKMRSAGVRSIQVHTGGECAMNANMTKEALDEFSADDLDIIFLENVGNLVCPAEEDVGSAVNIEILSIPEGDDKPLKYPLMFRVCQAVLVNKIDTRQYFDFNDELFVSRVKELNPSARIFFLSAKTGEGFEAWTDWIKENLSERT